MYTNNVILKYTIRVIGAQRIELPDGFRPLSVQVQGEQICLWAMVDKFSQLKSKYTFYITGTGQPCANFDAYTYLGTVQQGMFVWHVFYDPTPRR